jgi:hypothetical protein
MRGEYEAMRKLLICFAAGCLGGLANGLIVWWFGDLGVTKALGVAIAPELTRQFIYAKIVWGGIWGVAFIVPFMRSSPITKGVVLSIFPTLVQLFVVFPNQAHKGMLGLDLGLLTPVFVIFFNMVWGFVAGLAVKISK